MRIGITTDENNNLIKLEDSRYFVIFDDETKKEERYDSPAYKMPELKGDELISIDGIENINKNQDLTLRIKPLTC